MIALYSAHEMCLLSLKDAGALRTVKHRYTPNSSTRISTVSIQDVSQYIHYQNAMSDYMIYKIHTISLIQHTGIHFQKAILARIWNTNSLPYDEYCQRLFEHITNFRPDEVCRISECSSLAAVHAIRYPDEVASIIAMRRNKVLSGKWTLLTCPTRNIIDIL